MTNFNNIPEEKFQAMQNALNNRIKKDIIDEIKEIINKKNDLKSDLIKEFLTNLIKEFRNN